MTMDIWPIKVDAQPQEVDGLPAIAFCIAHEFNELPPTHGLIHRDVAIALHAALGDALMAQADQEVKS